MRVFCILKGLWRATGPMAASLYRMPKCGCCGNSVTMARRFLFSPDRTMYRLAETSHARHEESKWGAIVLKGSHLVTKPL
jgi:hypothetical protein